MPTVAHSRQAELRQTLRRFAVLTNVFFAMGFEVGLLAFFLFFGLDDRGLGGPSGHIGSDP